MSHFKPSALALSVGLVIGLGSVNTAIADVTYTYTSNDFTCCAIYALGPIPGSFVMSLTFSNNGSSLLGWSTNFIGDFSNSILSGPNGFPWEPISTADIINFQTNSVGQLTDWNVMLSSYYPGNPTSQELGSFSLGPNNASDFIGLSFAGLSVYGINTNNPGVWSSSGGTLNNFIYPIPEPETYAMLLSGLALIGFIAYRRRNNSSNTLAA
jgi:hypothetical protein